MTKSFSPTELVQLVTKIINAQGTEQEIDEWITAFQSQVPHPQAIDLIFHPDRVMDLTSEPELTAAEIVAIALAYQPISLPRHPHEGN
jgi:Colicin immunity protein / pyocin immunity protein